MHTPLNFAPRPQSLARRLFSDEVIEAHLDALASVQQEDGGWPVQLADLESYCGPRMAGDCDH